MNNNDNESKSKRVTPLSFMGSIVAAWFGVQSKNNLGRDFEHGKFSHFIIGGIIFAVIFVFVVVGIVQLVLFSAGQ